MSQGLETFMWRSNLPWPELVAVAERVLARWSGVTQFVTRVDARERIWTVRHHSTPQPFFLLSQDSLRGSAPRIGNPLPMLMLLGMARQRPGCVQISFASGLSIDPERFELDDLAGLLPHATHAVHRRLAELALTRE
ncbi:MAG: hypothetical protein QM803_01600 [Rhodocyclaceae bacterium]